MARKYHTTQQAIEEYVRAAMPLSTKTVQALPVQQIVPLIVRLSEALVAARFVAAPNKTTPTCSAYVEHLQQLIEELRVENQTLQDENSELRNKL